MLFISHSSKDLYIVEPLVDLIRSALVISPKDLRCSSLEGYRLPAGANIDETLRREVHEATVLIGLISFNSLQSMYVAFELGARWGSDQYFVPLIVPGMDRDILSGPLSNMNAISCESAGQLHQLLKELSEQLNVNLNTPDIYHRELEKIIKLPGVSKTQIPKYISGPLQQDYAKREEGLYNSQKVILDYIEKETEWRVSVPQKDIEAAFRGKYDSIYWRLETLCYLGFTDKEVSGRNGNTPIYNYKLAEEYRKALHI